MLHKTCSEDDRTPETLRRRKRSGGKAGGKESIAEQAAAQSQHLRQTTHSRWTG